MELWIPITIAAAFVQNIRSSLQKHLRGRMSTASATFVRFGYGIPFALLFLWLAMQATGTSLPRIPGVFLVWLVVAAASQIVAQVLLIMLFTMRNFAVGSAYIRTEPVLAAAFGIALLAELPSPMLVAAVIISVAGVMLVSVARTPLTLRNLVTSLGLPEARIGLASAAIFGLAAVAYRGASLSLGGPNFVVQGAVTLCFAIILQSAVLALWIVVREPGEFTRIAQNWRAGIAVGLAGALASFGWFMAMTLEQAAAVKAVAQVEMLFAFATTVFVFREAMNRAEVTGALLIVAGVVLLVLFG